VRCPAGVACQYGSVENGQGFQRCETGTFSRMGWCDTCPEDHTCVGGIKEPKYCTGSSGYDTTNWNVATATMVVLTRMSYGSPTYCVPCPKDEYCEHNKIISNCSVGEYFVDPDKDPAVNPGNYGCQPCPAGYKCNSTTNFIRTECDFTTGYYQDEPGQTTCKNCNYGIVTSTSCEQCPVGKIRNGYSCVECIRKNGEYQDEPGKTSCKTCDKVITQGSLIGYSTGMAYYMGIDCQDCPAGKYTTDFDLTAYCQDCPSGYYQSQAGQTTCENCPSSSTVVNETCVAPFECAPGQYLSSADQYVSNNCKQCEAGSYCPGYGDDAEAMGYNTYTGDRYNPSILCSSIQATKPMSPAGSSHYHDCTSPCTGELTFWNGTSCAQKHSIQYWCGGLSESPTDHLCAGWSSEHMTDCVAACQLYFGNLRPIGEDESDCADQSGYVKFWCRAKPESFTFTPNTNCIQSTTEAITSACKCAASSTTNECLEGFYCYDGGCENPVEECGDVTINNLSDKKEVINSKCKCADSSTTNECLIGKYCYDGGCENAAKGTPTTSTQCSNIDASVFQRLSAKTCSE